MNSVHIIGYLKEVKEQCFREIEVGIPTFDEEGNNSITLTLKYWVDGDKNYLTTLPMCAHVALIGHLEFDKKFGTIVIVEQLYCLKKDNENFTSN